MPANTPRKRRWFGGTIGPDTPWAALGVLLFWPVYWAGTQVEPLILYAGVLLVGTLLPAWAVFKRLKGTWADLGITSRRWLVSLAVAAFLGIGSGFQVFQLAAAQGVDPWSHIVSNVLVFWEPFFVFGFVYLAWERAFGIVPAVVLTSLGFALQHVGAVPFELALSFGGFAVLRHHLRTHPQPADPVAAVLRGQLRHRHAPVRLPLRLGPGAAVAGAAGGPGRRAGGVRSAVARASGEGGGRPACGESVGLSRPQRSSALAKCTRS